MLFSRKRLFALLLTLLSASLSANDQSYNDLPESVFPSLQDILRGSVSHSWRMIEEDLQVEEAKGEAETFAAGRYPSISGTFRYTGRLEDRDDFERTRSFYQPQAALTARQPLYHWGALAANARIGQIRSAIAEGNREEAYRLLVLQIRSSFLDLAIHEEAIRLAEVQRELAELEYDVASGSFDRGELTLEERTAYRLNLEERTLRLRRLRAERGRRIAEFAALTGMSFRDDAWVPNGIPVLPNDAANDSWSGIVEGGVWPRADLSQARIRQAEEQYRVERARDRPRIGLIAGLAQDQVAVFDRADINRTVLFAGVEVTWDIFDGYESRGRRSAAMARKRLEERRHERQQRDWVETLERLSQTLEWSERELRISEERLELERRALSQREEDLERGIISDVVMAESRVSLRERELAAAQRRADYLMVFAEYLSEAGMDPAMAHYRSRQR